MKKISIYSFLIAAVLLTGCSQKEVEVRNPNQTVSQETSESALNTIDNSNIQDEIVENDSLVQSDEDGYYYMINGKKELIKNIYFGFDKYSLTSEMKAVAKENANKLANLQTQTTIKVEGNCDEWGTDEYNYALGLKRAKVVKDTLVMDGINENSIKVVSLGESNPVCNEKNSACWQKNRRTEHKLVK